MAALNRVQLIGNCTRDPELRYTPKGTAVTEVGLAVNRVYSTDQGERREEVTFLDITFWGRQAEIAGEYLKKGRPFYAEGRLQVDVWDDKQTGEKRSKLKIIGDNLQLLGSRPADDLGQGQSERPTSRPAERPAARSTGRPAPPARPPADPDLDVGSEEIPF